MSVACGYRHCFSPYRKHEGGMRFLEHTNRVTKHGFSENSTTVNFIKGRKLPDNNVEIVDVFSNFSSVVPL